VGQRLYHVRFNVTTLFSISCILETRFYYPPGSVLRSRIIGWWSRI
jgi:hypothetical protein